MSNTKISSYVGLAQRAGSVVYGEDKIKERLKDCIVVLIDVNAPDAYKERMKNKCGDIAFVVELKDAVHREQVLSVGIVNAELGRAILELLR